MTARTPPVPGHGRLPVECLVLTHRRVELATKTVALMLDSGLDRVTVVVNAEGGIDRGSLGLDANGGQTVEVIELPDNDGPAAGYHHGLTHLLATTTAPWILICEDDLAAAAPPQRDLHEVIARVARYEVAYGVHVGVVAAYGRQLSRRTGLARPTPRRQTPLGLHRVDVAAWGSTLVRREVLEAGVFPDPAFFFGYEDFDWYLRARSAGFDTLVDEHHRAQMDGRERRTGAGVRVRHDDLTPWRIFYSTREFFRFARRHGTPFWTLVHLVRATRRVQLSGDARSITAFVQGVVAGVRRRDRRDPRWSRA